MSTKSNAVQQDTVRALFALFESMRHHMGELIQASGLALTPVHLRALDLCHTNPNCNQTQLVEQMRRDKSQIARIVQELERLRLLERKPDPLDARKQIMQVTRAGAEACELFNRLTNDLSALLFEDEEKESVKLMLKLSRRFTQRLKDSHALKASP
jgi:DNA-binding MarR family transcriptional regulator